MDGDAAPLPPLSASAAERRFLLLSTSRWLPVGVVFGLTILLSLERGLTLVQVGVLLSVQGFVVLGLEVPTGGLADAVGRRPLLVVAGVLAVISTVVFLLADSFWIFVVAIVIQGVFRALDSGPLEAWFVDAAHRSDPEAPVHRGLSRAGTALGVAIAAGAVVGGGLVAWHPIPGWSPLALPFVVAAVLYAVHTVLVAVLVREPTGRPHHDELQPARSRMRGVVGAVRDTARLVRRAPVLRALVLVEVFWSIAMIAFETLSPVRLTEILGAADAAGALFGPASAAAWALFAAGSAAVGLLSARVGVAWAAIIARILNGAFVIVMGLVGGVIGFIAAYWLAYATHGAAGPMHSALLHREASSSNRATVLSINSMVAGGSYSVGLLVLTAIADATSVPLGFVLAGSFSLLGALLYLPALRQERAG